MISAMNTAFSGLNAAEKRISVSASNIVNAQSTKSVVGGESVDTPYTPLAVAQVSTQDGVRAEATPKNPATLPVYNPDSPSADADGVVQMPNVDLAQEMVNMNIATYDFKANLNVIKKNDEMAQSLLDIVA